MSPVLPLPVSTHTTAPSRWWRIADVSVFGLWLSVVGLVVQHHEPWADESIAWLIARDLGLKKILFHELRYEGSPGLWHAILWIAQHWFGAPYGALGMIGFGCAAGGVAFILWKAPFPRPLLYLLVFSYFLVYQYAVVARSYTLLPLLLFAAASFYADLNRPVRMTIVLILLANVSLHGTLLALSFGSFYLIEAYRRRSTLGPAVRRHYPVCLAAMLLTLLFLFVILKPTPDVGEIQSAVTGVGEPKLMKLEALVTFAFVDQPVLSALFLLYAAGWCFMRRKLPLLALSVSLLTLLFVLVHGRPHHHGLLFLAVIAVVWVAWPSQSEMCAFSSAERAATYAMSGLLICVFCVNIWDAAVTMRNDYLYPYCGSADAARFLKRAGADRTTIFGYTYGMSAVQAYFDHNILSNVPTAYFHDGLPRYGVAMDLSELQSQMPEYVVVYSNDGAVTFETADPPLRMMGYRLVHFSEGNIFYKRFVFDTSSYYIYGRAVSSASE